jgi:NAD-dependent deacetylase
MEIPTDLRNALASASMVTAFTGAGISAESGVPTFRSAGGLWKKMKPEELASMDGFLRNPGLVWEWYAERKRIIADVMPNPGHKALAQMQDLFPRFAVVTQNIDNLHRRAGSRVVHELHGNIERNYCMECGRNYTNEAVLAMEGVPTCIDCKGRIRPDVVWFGEGLPEDEWEAGVKASEYADVFFSIGTSAVVYPAASLPLMAKRAGALLVEVNPEPTPLTPDVDVFLQGPAGAVLPAVFECALRDRKEKR